MMNYDEKINTEALRQDINNINKEKEKLNNLLKQLKNNNSELTDYWKSETSNAVFECFEDFYNRMEEIVNGLEGDTKFLNEKVINPYEEQEEITKSAIEEDLRG